MGPKGDRRVMTDLWLGHLAADLAAGALPAVLVFLKPVLHLSYTKAGAAVLVATVTSSIAQPLFGRWADRHTTTWLVPVGIAASAPGIVGLYAIIAQVFPTHVRAFGTGFTIGVGRGGSVLAPIIAGFLFAAGYSLPTVALILALGSLVAAVVLLFLELENDRPHIFF